MSKKPPRWDDFTHPLDYYEAMDRWIAQHEVEVIAVPQCKVCHAQIKVIQNGKDKTQMRVDSKPLTVVTELGHVIRAYIPHATSCAGVKQGRKSK